MKIWTILANNIKKPNGQFEKDYLENSDLSLAVSLAFE